MDIMNMKLKKSIDFKPLPKKGLNIPKLKKELPNNKGIQSIMKITNYKKPSFKGLNINAKRDNLSMYRLKQGNKANISGLIHNKNFPVPTVGRQRIRQQKGLKPWGDFDGDKVINMLDCNPRNKNLQGPEHTLEDKLETSQISPENTMEDQTNPSDELRRDYDTNARQEDKETERRRKELKELELKEERQKLSLLRRQQQEREQDIREKRKELERIESQKKKAKTVSKAKKAVEPITGSVTTISGAAKSFGGFGVSQQRILGATATNASQARLLTVLGKAPPVQQPLPQQQGTLEQAQEDPGTGVISPYSKRKVSYVRGPYKK